MSAPTFIWRGTAVPFRQGESLAAALMRAGGNDLGTDRAGSRLRYFCGIGACQNCLVSVNGRIVEACLTPAMRGQQVAAIETADD